MKGTFKLFISFVIHPLPYPYRLTKDTFQQLPVFLNLKRCNIVINNYYACQGNSRSRDLLIRSWRYGREGKGPFEGRPIIRSFINFSYS